MVKRNKDKWEELKKKIFKGQIISGKVIRVERFGVFVDIGEDFEAIVLAPHISEKKGITIDEYPKVGEVVKGIILDFSDDRNIDYNFANVSISIKNCP